MIPLRLELENFLSYRQVAAIDFGGVHLACISGENGAGKSSVVDAITWALFGKCRAPGRDDVVNRYAVAQGGAARVQLDLELEGNTYRVLRVQPAGKTGMLEFHLATSDGSWKSLTESSMLRTQERLETMLRMSYETFVNASFLLQGRADEFTIKGPADRKRILGELLGVSHWEQYKEEAARRRRELETELAGIDARLSEIETELAQEEYLQQRLKAARDEHTLAQKQREAHAQLVQGIRAYEAAVGQQRMLIQRLEDNLSQSRGTIARLAETRAIREAERRTLLEALEQAAVTERKYAAWQAAADEHRAWETKSSHWNRLNSERQQALLIVETARSRLEQERSELRRRKAEAAARAEEQDGIRQHLQRVLDQMATLQQQVANRETLHTRLGELQDQMGAIRGGQTRLKAEMQRLKARQIQLREEETGRCPLCGQPLTLDHRAEVVAQTEDEEAQLASQYRASEADIRQAQSELARVRASLQDLGRVEQELRETERKETAARTRLTEIERAVADWDESGAPRLAWVEGKLLRAEVAPDAQARISDLDGALAELGYEVGAHDATRRRAEELASAQDAYRLLGEARAALRPLETSLNDLSRQTEEQEGQVRQLAEQLNQAQASLDGLGPAPALSLLEAEREMNRLREAEVLASKAVGAAEQARRALEQLRVQGSRLRVGRKETAQTIGWLRTLERAFGRNGVQALLIEQALPAIQDTANELLQRLTVGGMRVRLSSQRQLKTRDALAETLDIHISDHAGERPYEMYSGGEAFRVNFAIRIALSRLVAQRAGARLQTLVIDEGFGSQDPDGRQRLVEAINTIQPDFARVLVITHIDELKDAFPVRIEVTKGPDGSQIAIS